MKPATAPPATAPSQKASGNGLASASITVLTQAELARCTCPDFCERDHDRD